jgi:predicted dehydrogenase
VRRVVVCGAGSIGTRHINNLLGLGASVSAWRSRSERGPELAEALGIPVHQDLDAAIANSDAVVVATATNRHMHVAAAAARAGKALFIEKPLSHDLEGIAEFQRLAENRRLVVEVGCQLRAHPSLLALKNRLASGSDGPIYAVRAAVGQRLDLWRPGTDYRECYSADSSKGGGALLDLIHEIDLALWLTGPIARVSAELAQVADLAIEAEDIACLTMATQDGALVQLEMDMVSPVYRRTLEVICRNAVYRWDDMGGDLLRADAHGSEVVIAVPRGFSRNDLFKAHMRHFLRRLDDASVEPLCALRDGVAALAVAVAARQASKQRCSIEIGAQ